MVHRRRYYYNERPFISVVYFGRLRTFCRCLPQNYLFHKLIASIMTATRNQLAQPAVLPTLANISKSARLSYISRLIWNEYLSCSQISSQFMFVSFDWHIWQIMRHIYFYNRHCFLCNVFLFCNFFQQSNVSQRVELIYCICTERKRNSCGNYIFDNSVI